MHAYQFRVTSDSPCIICLIHSYMVTVYIVVNCTRDNYRERERERETETVKMKVPKYYFTVSYVYHDLKENW